LIAGTTATKMTQNEMATTSIGL